MSLLGEFRRERDPLGEVLVPAEALYGAQTQRAVENFPLLGQRTLGDHAPVVDGLILCKLASAAANLDLDLLPERIASAILEAGRQCLDRDDGRAFPIHARHGGGGTSANMNANEVLANLAEEVLGGRRGEYRHVDPLEHVNLNQSTNDVYPTALHLALLRRWPALREAVGSLLQTLDQRRAELAELPRLARSCLQDAVPTTYGELFGSYRAVLARGLRRIDARVGDLREVPLGATIVGNPRDVPAGYLDQVMVHLREVTNDAELRHPEPLADGLQNPDTVVALSGELATLAGVLIKIAKDLRLLASGPEAGFGEVRLPAVQPGSSAMPLKVNPVIPEFVIQCAFRVLANHREATLGLEHGELDVNVWEASTALPPLEAMDLLEAACTVFVERCLAGLELDIERNRQHVDTIIPRLTRLRAEHGYLEVARCLREAGGDRERLVQLLAELEERAAGRLEGG